MVETYIGIIPLLPHDIFIYKLWISICKPWHFYWKSFYDIDLSFSHFVGIKENTCMCLILKLINNDHQPKEHEKSVEGHALKLTMASATMLLGF